MATQQASFADRLDWGRGRLASAFEPFVINAKEVVAETEKTLAALRAAESRPTQKTALEDIRAQLSMLVTASTFASLSLDRARHVPRYLKAIQTRLQRLPNDPIKDAQKATQVKPFWDAYLAKHAALHATHAEALEEFRWLIEELRVSVFAPELKTAVPVSPKRVEEVLRSLG
ncbi:MAG: DUF3418 domain-containing protein [Polyangiaceae bacterium]